MPPRLQGDRKLPEFRRRIKLVSLAALLLCTGMAAFSAPDSDGGRLQQARQGVAALQQWYDAAQGTYRTTGWWNSANALTALIDYARLGKSNEYNFLIANTFVAAQNQNAGFLNRYYDDEGWWALAWIDAYDLTGNKQYLVMAESIFANMSGGWDQTCGGGIWWSKDRTYKNAIANELFLSVAAHLANRDTAHRDEYLGWANREWKWFAATGMINRDDLVNDGLGPAHGPTTAASCGNNGRTTWTYNQGVLLGGVAELSRLNPNPSLLQTAEKIAAAAIAHLADQNGVLHEPCEPHCGADAVQFKGIFVRNLVALDRASPQLAYGAFLEANAHAIWSRDRGPGGQFGEVWSGPFADANAASQSSALDALVGAAELEPTDKRNTQ
jgi:predicted alpha-1,6-mannanase (GH76 family)